MIKLRSAIKHRSQQASDFFNCKTYVVPACFAINRTDTMCHGTKSSYKTVFKRASYLIIIKTTLEYLLLRHDLLLHKLSSIFDETFHHLAAVFYAPFILTITFLCLAMSWTPFDLIWLTRMILDFTWPKNSFLSKLNWKHSYPSLCNMEAELYPTPTLLDTSIVDSTTEEVHQKLVSDTLHCLRQKYTVILVLMFYLFC